MAGVWCALKRNHGATVKLTKLSVGLEAAAQRHVQFPRNSNSKLLTVGHLAIIASIPLRCEDFREK